VIVKACNYILKPGEEYHGSWHVEGLPHEHIIATGIYYYESSEAIEEQLMFRRLRQNHGCKSKTTTSKVVIGMTSTTSLTQATSTWMILQRLHSTNPNWNNIRTAITAGKTAKSLTQHLPLLKLVLSPLSPGLRTCRRLHQLTAAPGQLPLPACDGGRH
jgi:hypothetical protein